MDFKNQTNIQYLRLLTEASFILYVPKALSLTHMSRQNDWRETTVVTRGKKFYYIRWGEAWTWPVRAAICLGMIKKRLKPLYEPVVAVIESNDILPLL